MKQNGGNVIHNIHKLKGISFLKITLINSTNLKGNYKRTIILSNNIMETVGKDYSTLINAKKN